MEIPRECLEIVLSTLNSCRGVQSLKVMTEEDKERILKIEEKAEDEIAYAMCKTLNLGVREAVKREITIALLIDSSVIKPFKERPFPILTIFCPEERIVKSLSPLGFAIKSLTVFVPKSMAAIFLFISQAKISEGKFWK